MVSHCSSGQKVRRPTAISSSASDPSLFRSSESQVEGAGIRIVSFVVLAECVVTAGASGRLATGVGSPMSWPAL